MSWYQSWAPYVPVHRRRANATAAAAKLAKKQKREAAPIAITGRLIASSFWGKAWCVHLEKFSDISNRLPRGRTYVKNGSVVDLHISAGKIRAIVAGSEVYEVEIDIKTLPAAAWSKIKNDCTRSVASLIDLLQGRFDAAVMTRLTEKETGLFPKSKEIEMDCSCPDGAHMCKHIAAVLYGIGARLDHAPELLFTLRDVDHLELISQAVSSDNLDQSLQGKSDTSIAASDLGDIFGIEMDTGEASPAAVKPKRRAAKSTPSDPGNAGKSTMSKPAVSATAAELRAVKKSPRPKPKPKSPARKGAVKSNVEGP